MKIATWNMGSLYENGNYEQNVVLFQRILEKVSADIICLQECPDDEELQQKIMTWGNYSHSCLEMYADNHNCPGHKMGLAVFTKAAIEKRSSVVLHSPRPRGKNVYTHVLEDIHDKVFMTIDIADNDTPMRIVTGHGFCFHRYGWDDDRQLHEEAYKDLDKYLRDELDGVDDRIHIVCADFNYDRIQNDVAFLMEQYEDVFDQELTRPSNRKTDGLFVKKGLQYQLAGMVRSIRNKPEGLGFDHYLLWVEI